MAVCHQATCCQQMDIRRDHVLLSGVGIPLSFLGIAMLVACCMSVPFHNRHEFESQTNLQLCARVAVENERNMQASSRCRIGLRDVEAINGTLNTQGNAWPLGRASTTTTSSHLRHLHRPQTTTFQFDNESFYARILNAGAPCAMSNRVPTQAKQ